MWFNLTWFLIRNLMSGDADELIGISRCMMDEASTLTSFVVTGPGLGHVAISDTKRNQTK
jgi:hypothetical protein